MSRFKPAIFIGLGTHGAKVASALRDIVAEGAPAFADFVQCLNLTDDGHWQVGGSDGPTKVAGLGTQLAEGVFAKNYFAVADAEDEIAELMATFFSNFRKQEKIAAIQEAGHSVDDRTTIYLVTPLCDAVGSAALFPILAILNRVFSLRLRGLQAEISICGLFPDVFEQYRQNDLAHARTYRVLQEIEFANDNQDLQSTIQRPLFGNCYLFSRTNEASVAVDGPDDLAHLVGEVLTAIHEQKIASDSSFTVGLLRMVEGKRSRYSSIGLAKLVYPKKEIGQALGKYVTSLVLEPFVPPQVTIPLFDTVATDVQAVVTDSGLDRVVEAAALDVDGKTIWQELSVAGSIHERDMVEQVLNELDKEFAEFETQTFATMVWALALKRDTLTSKYTEVLTDAVKLRLNQQLQGPGYAAAFVDLFASGHSERTRGDASDIYGLNIVRDRIKLFFDNVWGVDRAELRQVALDLAGKKSLLSAREERYARSAEIETPENLQELAGEIEQLKGVVAALQGKQSDLERKFRQIDSQIADPVERRLRYDNADKEDLEKRGPIIDVAQDADRALALANVAMKQAAEERQRAFVKDFVFIPIAGAVLYLAIAAAISAWVPFGARIVGGLGVGISYFVWAALQFLNGPHARFKATQVQAENARTDKMRAIMALRDWFNGRFKRKFDFALHGGLIGWLQDFEGFVRQRRHSITRFVAALEKEAQTSRADFENAQFVSSGFVRSAVGKDDLAKMVSDNRRVKIELETVFSRQPLSHFYEQFDVSGTLEMLERHTDTFAYDIFSEAIEKPLERFLVDQLASRQINQDERYQTLFRSASAFISLDVETGHDKADSLVYVGVADPDTSTVAESLTRGGAPVTRFAIGNQQEVSLIRLKVGFPAFHMSILRYCRELNARMHSTSVATNNSWELDDVFPTQSLGGNDSDEARRLFVMGLALELIQKRSGKYSLKDTELGQSPEACVQLVRSLSGAEQRRKLKQLVSDALSQEAATSQLNEYLSKSTDATDRSIVAAEITRRSSL